MARKYELSRLEESFVNYGINDFNIKQIVELIVCRMVNKNDCRRITNEVGGRYRTLREFINAPAEELRAIPGMNEQCIIAIKMIHDLPSRYLKEEIIQKPFCTSSQEIFDYLYYSMRDLKKEVFRVFI